VDGLNGAGGMEERIQQEPDFGSVKTVRYLDQVSNLPPEGRHILAQYTHDSVIVYQAYKLSIGKFAATNNYFGGDFSFSKMSWIKPNFLWMMYRSGWGTKSGQEVTLAVRIKRSFFDDILREAVASTNINNIPHEEWRHQVARSNVRLQWDPDHDPFGKPVERKAIQLGLRNDFLLPFKGESIVEIIDISLFVAAQRELLAKDGLQSLLVPREKSYPVDEATAATLGMQDDNNPARRHLRR